MAFFLRDSMCFGNLSMLAARAKFIDRKRTTKLKGRSHTVRVARYTNSLTHRMRFN